LKNIYLENWYTDTHLLPRATNSYDIGSTTGPLYLRKVYTTDLRINGLTASRPLKLDANKDATAGKIDLGVANDIAATGIADTEVLFWDGTAGTVDGIAGLTDTQSFVTSIGGSGSGTIPATIDTTGMSGDALTIANKVNDLLTALGVGGTVLTGISNGAKVITSTKGVITAWT